jgi:hypothetical protein
MRGLRPRSRFPSNWEYRPSPDEPPLDPPLMPLRPGSAPVSRGLSRSRLVALVVLLGLVAAAVVFALKREGPVRPHQASAPEAGGYSSVAWQVQAAGRTFVSVFAASDVGRSIAVVIPAEVAVDIPGGPATVGEAVQADGLLLPTVQAVLGHRVHHTLISDEPAFSALVDRLGGVQVVIEGVFSFGGRDLGPGSTRLTGAEILAYLNGADTTDVLARWQEVLTGVLSGARSDSFAQGLPGVSEFPALVGADLAMANRAKVEILPTEEAADGGIQANTEATDKLLEPVFVAQDATLVRVIVLNGNGRPGVSLSLARTLAPAGFRIVAAQNATSFDQFETQIVAASDAFLPQASRILGLLGVGKVYVGQQPTGIADVTVVVGKDYQPA